MKKQILLFLLMSFIPWSAWASSNSLNDEDEGYFKAFVPLNGNDSIEMTFYIISEEEKTVDIGYWDVCVDTSVKGEIEIPLSVNGYKVKMIGDNAFYGCNGLTTITLPHSITYIGRYAFGDCPKVVIPCSEIPELEYVYGDDPNLLPYLGWGKGSVVDAFSPDCKIYVPFTMLETYKNTFTWKLIANQICAIEGETNFDISVHAQGQTSDISSVIGEGHLNHVLSLKLSGSINGYDIKIIREKMPFLRQLDLSDVEIVANNYPYYTDGNGNNYYTENDVLGDYCFSNMENLRDIFLPKNIQSIGQYAFDGCNNIKNVSVNNIRPLPIASSTFSNCANATLSVPEGCKEIYLSANYWKDFKEIMECSGIIHFDDKTVEWICMSNWDFNDDQRLTYEELAKVKAIHSEDEYIRYPSGIFIKNDKITSFDEFKYFSGLEYIRSYEFYGCSNLSSIILPESITFINGSYDMHHGRFGAFQGCSKLSSINIPERVKGVGNKAFYGCINLKKVHISNLRSWLDIEFTDLTANPLSYAHHLLLDNQEVTNIQIPEDLTSIKKYVFSGCEGLTSVSLPNTITSIGAFAFNGCI